MACNKRNTQYSTHFPRPEGGSGRNLWIGNWGSELGTIRGTRRTAYHFQFVIVFIFVFVWIFFSLLFALYAPLSPPCSGNMVLLHVARSPPSHSLCMSFAWQKSKKKWTKWAASWRLGRNNTKTTATTSDKTIRYPLGTGQLTEQAKYEKSSSNQNLFLVCWTK